MGMFDYVSVSGPEFVCSEGHDLSDEEFQSKDFGCEMGQVRIECGRVSCRAACLGTPSAESDQVEVYGTCRRCPAFVQRGTGNLIACWVEFAVKLDGDAVVSVTRTSPPTAEFLRGTPLEKYMRGCEGPMPHTEARELHCNYAAMRPERRAEFDAWSRARAEAYRTGRPWPLDLQIGEYPPEETTE